MKKHDLTPFLALFGLFLLFVGFVLLLVWGQQSNRFAAVALVVICAGCTLLGLGIGKLVSRRLKGVLDDPAAKKEKGSPQGEDDPESNP